jgi:lipopolysaccharide transport system permease protein
MPMYDIQPVRGWSVPNLRELWEYRELLYFLTWRDLKVRYKQTALGVGWAIIPSIFNMIIFSVIFGGLAKLPSEGAPYAVFSYIGLDEGWIAGGFRLFTHDSTVGMAKLAAYGRSVYYLAWL